MEYAKCNWDEPAVVMSQPMEIVGVDFHGASVNVQSSHSPLVAYAKQHLHQQAGPAHSHPSITVQCLWSEGKCDEDHNPFAMDGRFNAVGKRMLSNSQELIWLNTLRKKGLQLRFRREPEGHFFEVAYSYHPNERHWQSNDHHEYRKYISLMDYLVYFPVLWYLERERGWTTIHASALLFEGRSVIIAGLGGTGKTTTCVALLQQPGFELISENIIFTDGEFIYPCYEPVQLNKDSLTMLNGVKFQLIPAAFPECVKEKSLFHFNISNKAKRTEPVAVFLPQFSDQSYVKELSPSLAAEKIIAMNHLALELNDYNWYASALDMQWPKLGLATERLEVIRKFASIPRWYELGIDRKAGLAQTVKDILSNIKN